MSRSRLLVLQGMLAEYRRPLFNRLAEHFDVTVAHAGPPGVRAEDRFREVVLSVRQVGRFRFVSRRPLRREIADADTVVAMFDLAWPQFVCPALHGRTRLKYVLWGHRYGASKMANGLRDMIMRGSSALLMYGTEHHARMASARIAPEKIFVAPNTMDIPNHRDTSSLEKDRFLFVGRLQARKRLAGLIRAFESIAPLLPARYTLDIVGSGAEEDVLRRQALSGGIADRVVFHGEVRDDAQLADLFARSVAYVSPGAVGLSLLHSFAYGVPVLTIADRQNYHGPEIEALTPGENGLLARSEADLASDMLTMSQNPSQAAAMGAAAYRCYVESRTVDRMVDSFVAAAAASRSGAST